MIPKYDKSKIGPCDEWKGEKYHSGYGKDTLNGKTTGAHRAAWIRQNGKIPHGLFVCHKCDNRACVRLDHLFLGTAKENNADAVEKGRLTRQLQKRFLSREQKLSSFINRIERIQRHRWIIETCAKQNRMTRRTIDAIHETTHPIQHKTIMRWRIEQLISGKQKS